MKTDSPQRHRGTENSRPIRRERGHLGSAWIFSVALCLCGSGFAASADPGRLFYTPAQRAQLEAARARNISELTPGTPEPGPSAQRFDGMLIRSDGSTTRWVNGRAQLGGSGVVGLKPGQIRADGRVYEAYQVLRPHAPEPAHPDPKDSRP